MNEDKWMSRIATHAALKHFFYFMAEEDNPNQCIAIRSKEHGAVLYEGNPELKKILDGNFKDLQEAAFFDFGKELAESIKDEQGEVI